VVKLTPWGRAISPHRQIWLLLGVVLVAIGLGFGGMVLSLAPANAHFGRLDDQLIPARDRIDEAAASYALTAQNLETAAVNDNPAQRDAAFAALATSNSAGEAAWKAFQRFSANLPGEAALVKTFETDRQIGLTAGVPFLQAPVTSVAEFAKVVQLSNTMLIDLSRIKLLYQAEVRRTVHSTDQDLDSARQTLFVLAGTVLVGLSIAFGVASRNARKRELSVEELNRTLADGASRNELEARLQRSLEMVKTEEDSYTLLTRALSNCAPGLATELLLADSSQAHFRQVTATPELDVSGCAVLSPRDCPAANRGQTQVWRSSTDLDSCPYLQDRPGGALSALCVPVSIAGNTVGVLHSIAEDGNPPPSSTVVNVELISRKAGERIGMLRAFTKSEVQAHTDPLTGLMNRRSLEIAVRALTSEERPYIVAYGDLDHFKQLNDVYGHDAGDRALRLFARVVRDSLRPTDIPARYGGEEFVIVIPECSLADAVIVIDRMRKKLATAQHGASVPPFTVSFGVASAQFGTPFNDMVELADAALLEAKALGRDRVVTAGADNDTDVLEVGEAPATPSLARSS